MSKSAQIQTCTRHTERDGHKERKRAGDRMIIITAFNDKRYEWAFEHIFQLRQMKKKSEIANYVANKSVPINSNEIAH